MEKDVKKYSLYLIAIVAIVAVVGIVVMTTNYGGFSGFSGTTNEDVLTSDEGEVSESVGLAGQAYTKLGCNDPDAVSSKMTKDQYYVKTEVTDKKGLKKPDMCVTNKKGITSLYEAWCLPSGVSSYYVQNCNTLNTAGTDYKCVDGACEECSFNVVTSECQGNTYHNISKNICTGETKEDFYQCSKENVWPETTKQSKICLIQGSFAGCGVDCVVGTYIYSCEKDWKSGSYNYIPYICEEYSNTKNMYYSKNFQQDYSSSISKVRSCPSGATCYNPEGKCEGPKTT